ncbi:MAG: diacylglycerol kinase family lipid kinase [Dehalococcoidales bacterium]|nr:diacylglycerol kinase family lipid kinase [Dehalococcoidales bacterium]
MQNAKFIVNPVAGALSTKKKWPLISSLLKHLGVSFDYQYTEGIGHAIELAKDATNRGYDHVVAVGGDGTINEVANGILTSKSIASTTLGVISTGTGSDFIRSVGIPHDYIEACSCLSQGQSKPVDIGVVEYQKNNIPMQRYFINTAGIGFDAAVISSVEKSSKRLGGTIPFLLGVLRTLVTYRNKVVKVTIGDNEESKKVVMVMVANGRYGGGGMKFAPTAQLDDGLLDMLIISDMGKLELLKAFPTVYKGTHINNPKVKLLQTDHVKIDSLEKIPVYADGELLGEGPIVFRLLPAMLRIKV